MPMPSAGTPAAPAAEPAGTGPMTWIPLRALGVAVSLGRACDLTRLARTALRRSGFTRRALARAARSEVSTAGPRAATPARARRQPETWHQVTGTTPAGDRTVIGLGCIEPDSAAELAANWSRSTRFTVTAVRLMPSGQPIAAYRGGVQIPVPRAERQPTHAEHAAALAGLDRIAGQVAAMASAYAIASPGQAAQLGPLVRHLDASVRTLRGARPRPRRPARLPRGLHLAGRPASPHMHPRIRTRRLQ